MGCETLDHIAAKLSWVACPAPGKRLGERRPKRQEASSFESLPNMPTNPLRPACPALGRRLGGRRRRRQQQLGQLVIVGLARSQGQRRLLR